MDIQTIQIRPKCKLKIDLPDILKCEKILQKLLNNNYTTVSFKIFTDVQFRILFRFSE